MYSFEEKNLSEEMIELYTSFECGESLDNIENTDYSRNNQNTAYSKKNTFDQSIHGYSEDVSLRTNDTAASNLTRTFQGLTLSLNYSNYISNSKLQEVKNAISEANIAFKKHMMNQMILDSFKTNEAYIQQPLKEKMRHVLLGSKLKKINVLKNRNGDSMTVLGLAQEATDDMVNLRLTSQEAQTLNNGAMNILTCSFEKMSENKTLLKGTFRPHCDKLVDSDSLLPKELERLSHLHHQLSELMSQSRQQLTSTSHMMQQLSTRVTSSQQQLDRITFTLLQNKAKYLHTATSLLRLKSDQTLNADRDRVKAINSLGDELSSSVKDLNHRLKSLQKTLAGYEKKEETSKQYKEIIVEYAKCKRHLNHKYQTLNLLNDPNVSFS